MSYLDGARSLAVDTLDLVLADDGVLEGTAILDDENSVLVTTLDLTSALGTTAVGLHATIEGAADLLGRLVGNRALGGGHGEGSTLLNGGVSGRSDGSRAGGSEASNGSDDSERELHFDGGLVGLEL